MNPAAPRSGDALANEADVPEAGAIVRDFANGEARFSLLLAKRDGVIRAYENRCPHAGAPLERMDGRVLVLQGRFILCTAHAATFAIETGACAGGPAGSERGLTQVPIVIEAGVIKRS